MVRRWGRMEHRNHGVATITKRKRQDGSFGYRAAIRIKQGGRIVHTESKTFDQRRQAEAWARAREVELQAPGALDRAAQRHTVKDLIDWYLKTFGGAYGRTKNSTLKQMAEYAIGAERAAGLTSERIIAHINERRQNGAGPSTANHDLIWLRVLFKAARPALGLPLDLAAIDDAARYCRNQRLVGKPRRRDRRPADDELSMLAEYFAHRDKRSDLPMVDIMWFAIWSARRQEEITRLHWADIDETNHTGVVRDAKHPTAKAGNHRTFKFTPEAWEIVQRQPKTSEFIFPYNGKSISAAFTRACHACGIEGLCFHDLRHEAVSRLFERGLPIHHVQMISLHESWNTLKRYTQLKPGDLKF